MPRKKGKGRGQQRQAAEPAPGGGGHGQAQAAAAEPPVPGAQQHRQDLPRQQAEPYQQQVQQQPVQQQRGPQQQPVQQQQQRGPQQQPVQQQQQRGPQQQPVQQQQQQRGPQQQPVQQQQQRGPQQQPVQQQQQRGPQQQSVQQQQQRGPQQQPVQQQQRGPQQQPVQQQQRGPQQQPVQQQPQRGPQQQPVQQQQAHPDEQGGARPRTGPSISGRVGSAQQQMQALTLKESYDFPAPQYGTIGRKIQLIANHFKVDLPNGSVFHYDVDIRPIKKNGKGKKDEESDVPRVGVKPKGTARRLNPKLCRDVIELMLRKYKMKESHWPAYDGNKNLYTRKRLPIVKETQFEVSLMKVPGDAGSEEKFQVTVKPAEKEGTGDCEVSLEPLHYLCEGRSNTYPEEAVLALDIILRYGPSLRFVPVGRSFFMRPRTTEEVPLEEGRAVWFGYHQSLRPGWKPLPKGFSTSFYLNIDKSTTAFLRNMNLVDFSLEVLHMRQRPVTFSKEDVRVLNKREKGVRGIQVQALHLQYPRKYKIVKILEDKARTLTFKMNDQDITVERYFRVQYGRNLQYPNYPCVQVGDPQRKVYVPMEMLQVVDAQPSPGKLTPNQSAEMIKYTAIPPKDRFEEITRYVKQTRDNNKEILNEFEINIHTDPVQFCGRILPPPSVEYKDSKAPVRDGQWEMRGKYFIRALTIRKWVILSLCRAEANDLRAFAQSLRKSGADSGMNIFDICGPPGLHSAQPGGVGQILQEYKRIYPDLELAVVVLPKNSVLYKEVKHEGETKVGLITQCVTDENMRKCRNERFSFRFLMNICQKINAKLGGTNVSLQKDDKPHIFKSPVIVIGADVTHPPPGAQDGYSIAACVGSIDGYPARYVPKIQIQKVHSEVRAREERILELKLMIKDLLKDFYRAIKHKPERIIFFRDGVSEGQFLQVRNYELQQIRDACTSLQQDYKPMISYIVVQKRHHTRFAPQNFQDGLQRYNCNIPAGTTVDTDITHPSYFNFFLASHVALQGTTRPAHYTILWDDNDFSADTLQKFVFYLCHTYNRCTRSVSIPPPVMYADLAAYRAKLYIDNKMESMSSTSTADSDSSALLEEFMNTIKTSDNLKNEMYFI